MTGRDSEAAQEVIVTMSPKLLAQVDGLVNEQLFVDRQEFIRIAVKNYAERMQRQQKEQYSLERVQAV